MNLLEVKNISKTYGNGETAVKALKDVCFWELLTTIREMDGVKHE